MEVTSLFVLFTIETRYSAIQNRCKFPGQASLLSDTSTSTGFSCGAIDRRYTAFSCDLPCSPACSFSDLANIVSNVNIVKRSRVFCLQTVRPLPSKPSNQRRCSSDLQFQRPIHLCRCASLKTRLLRNNKPCVVSSNASCDVFIPRIRK